MRKLAVRFAVATNFILFGMGGGAFATAYDLATGISSPERVEGHFGALSAVYAWKNSALVVEADCEVEKPFLVTSASKPQEPGKLEECWVRQPMYYLIGETGQPSRIQVEPNSRVYAFCSDDRRVPIALVQTGRTLEISEFTEVGRRITLVPNELKPDASVCKICVDSNHIAVVGRTWIAVLDRNDRRWHSYRIGQGKPIKAICRDGFVYVAGRHFESPVGICRLRLEDGEIKFYEAAVMCPRMATIPLENLEIIDMDIDNNGLLWLLMSHAYYPPTKDDPIGKSSEAVYSVDMRKSNPRGSEADLNLSSKHIRALHCTPAGLVTASDTDGLTVHTRTSSLRLTPNWQATDEITGLTMPSDLSAAIATKYGKLYACDLATGSITEKIIRIGLRQNDQFVDPDSAYTRSVMPGEVTSLPIGMDESQPKSGRPANR